MAMAASIEKNLVFFSGKTFDADCTILRNVPEASRCETVRSVKRTYEVLSLFENKRALASWKFGRPTAAR